MRRSVPFLFLIALSSSCEDGESPSEEYHGRVVERQQLDYGGNPVVITTYTYDKTGLLVTEHLRDSSAVGMRESEKIRSYEDGELVSIEAFDPPGVLDYTWRFEYSNNLLIREFGSLPSDSVFETIRYSHNANGDVVREENERGNTTTTRSFTYDEQNRLLKATSYDAQQNVVMTNLFVYVDADTLVDTVRFIQPHGPSKLIAYTYDEAGQTLAEKEPRPDGSSRLIRSYTYDMDGNILVEEDHSTGNRIDYFYENGNLHLVKHQVAGGRTVGLVFYE